MMCSESVTQEQKRGKKLLPSNTKTCRICGGQDFKFFLRKDSFVLLQCKGCHVVFLDVVMERDDAKRIYSESYFKNKNGTHVGGYPDYFAMHGAFNKTFSKRIAKIRVIKPNGRLLDIGCGPGFFLEIAKKYFEVTGIEISDFAAAYAREHFSLDVLNAPFEECALEQDKFDVVTMWDTIEHLFDPQRALLKIHKILKVGGLFVFQTGDISSFFARVMKQRWHLYNVPEHTYFFSQSVIKDILTKTGFSIHGLYHEGSYYSVSYLFNRLMRTLFTPRTYRNHHSFLSKVTLPVNLFDIMTVYALKRE